jgi:capsule biosynthesis phosphatase
MAKRLVMDLDGTLTIDDPEHGYDQKEPNRAVLRRLREYKAAGFEIIIYSARNMKTYGAAVGKINARTLPGIIAWLDRHDVPYDEIHVGKPWCGEEGFYVDDRAIRPDEFARLEPSEIARLLGREPADDAQ